MLATSCSKKPAEYVNPLMGTDAHGHTFPGAIVPFGQIQPGPDTRLQGWDGCSVYHYSDDTIYGFSHTHLNGTGVEDYGDVMVMPVKRGTATDFAKKSYRSAFSHSHETAQPGYYKVLLEGPQVTAELTTTRRVAWHRYTFADGEKNGIVIDLDHRDKLLAGNIRQDGDLIVGYRESKSWNPDQKVFFAIRCPEMESIEYNNDSCIQATIVLKEGTLTAELQVAISSVDEEGAIKNLNSDGPWEGRSFDQVKAAATEQWNNELGKIEINGGSTEQKKTFYTALYHCMVSPYLYSDADGRYRGMDGEIHTTAGSHEMYTVFSLWDTYRALHPLLNMIDKSRSEDFIYSMLNQYKEGGELTMWELWGHETRCMIGYHACPVILDAFNNGILDKWSRDDKEKLLEGMLATANMDALGRVEYGRDGYLSSEIDNESVSKTLEYAYDDWCIAQYAKALGGHEDIYDEYMRRAQSWKNLMDEEGYMHARRNGGFLTPFDPTEVNNNFTEGNSWQYSSYVPQDVAGWAELMGGDEKAVEFLDGLFLGSSEMSGREQVDITGLIGQYAHGNEPSHHAAYLYTYFGNAGKTKELVHQILNNFYSSAPDGDCGNEDCGQMGAWYVMSSIGMYPVCPGSGEFVTVEPIFGKIVLHVEGAEPLVIDRSKWQGGKFWKDGQFNDQPTAFDGRRITLVPYFDDWNPSFSGTKEVAIKSRNNDKIYYTTDGSTPDTNATLYTKPITVDGDMAISAVAYNAETGYSKVEHHKMTRFVADRTLSYSLSPAQQYSEGGPDALIDRMHGTSNYRIGGWQGWDGDMEVVIDLKSTKKVSQVDVGFLCDMKSWIFLPREMTVATSTDGKSYKVAGTVKNTKPALKEEEEHPSVDHLILKCSANARYVKVSCKNYGPMPDWHVSPGAQAWLFVDEVEVR